MATQASSIQSVTRGSVAFVRVYGVIDESFDPDKLAAVAKGNDVIINLKAVSRLSSFGVREWVHGVTKLAANANKVYYVECSPAIVAQLNMIANFAGDAQIVSVQVPMICSACSWDAEMLVDMTKHSPTSLPSMACKRCSANMELDDLPELYFAFAAATPTQIDPTVEAFLRDFENALPSSEASPQEAVVAAPTPPAQPPAPAPPAAPTPVVSEPEPEPDPAPTPASLSARELSFAKSKPPYALIGGAVVVLAGIGIWLGTREPQPEPPPLVNAKPRVQTPVSQPASLPASAPVEKVEPPKVDAQAEKTKALAAYAIKNYETAVKAGLIARANGVSDPELTLALAQAQRQLKQPEAAMALYDELEQTLPPKDKRLDNVLFDHAELLSASETPVAAKPLYERLIKEFPRSTHKKAAKAKLGKLKKLAKKKR